MNKKIKKIIEKNKYRSEFYKNYKSKKKQKTSKKQETKNRFDKIHSFVNKIMISICVLLFLLICKDSEKIKFIYQQTFKNMNFVQIKSYVNNRLNGIFPKTNDPNKYVGAIVIDMSNTNNYRDGVIIETDFSAPVESIVSGIVIQIYHDDELGKVIVIQDINGREYHYGFLDTIEVKLYSSVEYGDILGLGRLNDDMNGEYYLAIKDDYTYLDVIDVVNYEN